MTWCDRCDRCDIVDEWDDIDDDLLVDLDDLLDLLSRFIPLNTCESCARTFRIAEVKSLMSSGSSTASSVLLELQFFELSFSFWEHVFVALTSQLVDCAKFSVNAVLFSGSEPFSECKGLFSKFDCSVSLSFIHVNSFMIVALESSVTLCKTRTPNDSVAD